MTDESRSTAQDAQSAREAKARAQGGVGRRVGLALYLTGLVYVIAVAFVSITTQVFAPPSPDAVQATAGVSCEDGARDLARQLRAHATAHVEGTSHPPDDRFFSAWDRTHHALSARCDQPRYQSLSRLRHRMEITLRRFDREEGAAFARLARGLEAPTRAEP